MASKSRSYRSFGILIPVFVLGCASGESRVLQRDPVVRMNQPWVGRGVPANSGSFQDPTAPIRPILPGDSTVRVIPGIPGNAVVRVVPGSETIIAAPGQSFPHSRVVEGPVLPSTPAMTPVALEKGSMTDEPPVALAASERLVVQPASREVPVPLPDLTPPAPLPGLEKETPKPVETDTPKFREPLKIPGPAEPQNNSPSSVASAQPMPIPKGKYGHAADYRWLAGVIDLHREGAVFLRYRDLAEEDRWGGKVLLVDDPRLPTLKDGAEVFVEGQLIPPERVGMRKPLAMYPSYRITVLKIKDAR